MCSVSRCTVPVHESGPALAVSSQNLIHRQDLIKLLKTSSDKIATFTLEEDVPDFSDSKNFEGAKTIHLATGFSKASDPTFREQYGSKKLIFLCPGETRSAILAEHFAKSGYDACALAGGLAAWRDPINCVFPFVVLLGYGVQNVDKVCTALSMACVAQKTRNTCIILASDGVELGIKGKLKGDETSGEPFLTISEYLKQFTESGGVIFCCTSCVKLRKAMDNMEPFCVLASAPDVVRWLSTCKGSLQFA